MGRQNYLNRENILEENEQKNTWMTGPGFHRPGIIPGARPVAKKTRIARMNDEISAHCCIHIPPGIPGGIL
jgi:hypothetical protein